MFSVFKHSSTIIMECTTVADSNKSEGSSVAKNYSPNWKCYYHTALVLERSLSVSLLSAPVF